MGALYDYSKVIHVIAAALWLGGGVMIGMLNGLVGQMQDPSASAKLARAGASLGKKFFMPVAIVTLVFGVIMVIDADAIEFSQAWISIGFAGIIAGAVLGPVKLEPAGVAVAEALEAQPFDPDRVQAAIATMRMWSMVDLALLVVVFWAMVVKPGL